MAHRLRITDDTPVNGGRSFDCSCGLHIADHDGSWPLHTQRKMAAVAVSQWRDHRYHPLRMQEPAPAAVTIWIEPTQQWRTIPWNIYASGRLVLVKAPDFRRLPDPEGTNDAAFELSQEYLTISPMPGNPLIWR